MKKNYIIRTDEEGCCDEDCELKHQFYFKYKTENICCFDMGVEDDQDDTIMHPKKECPLFGKKDIEMNITLELTQNKEEVLVKEEDQNIFNSEINSRVSYLERGIKEKFSKIETKLEELDKISKRAIYKNKGEEK